jgi:hypothetical protein
VENCHSAKNRAWAKISTFATNKKITICKNIHVKSIKLVQVDVFSFNYVEFSSSYGDLDFKGLQQH